MFSQGIEFAHSRPLFVPFSRVVTDDTKTGQIERELFLHWYEHEHELIESRQRRQAGLEHFVHGDEMNFFGHFAPKKAARRSLIKKLVAVMYRGGATITSVDDEALGIMLRAGLGERIFARPAYDTRLPPEPDTAEGRALMHAAKEKRKSVHIAAQWELRPEPMHIVQEPADYTMDVETILEEEEDETNRRKIAARGGGKLSDDQVEKQVRHLRHARHKEKQKQKEQELKRKLAMGMPMWKIKMEESGQRKKRQLYPGIKSVL